MSKVIDKRPSDLEVGDKELEELGVKTIYLITHSGGVVAYESEHNALQVASVVGDCDVMKVALYPKIESLTES